MRFAPPEAAPQSPHSRRPAPPSTAVLPHASDPNHDPDGAVLRLSDSARAACSPAASSQAPAAAALPGSPAGRAYAVSTPPRHLGPLGSLLHASTVMQPCSYRALSCLILLCYTTACMTSICHGHIVMASL